MRRGLEGLMVGRTLAGRYDVVDAIARGGMSVVYRGLDRTLGREVGVKVVSLAAASDSALANFRERFRREAASAARIQHPNVVQIFDYGTDPELELDFIVMELLRGRDLKEELRQTPLLPRPEALRILADAARGVAAGHRAGIVHRDVKPANVFLVGEGNVDVVKILDFGIAKPMEDDPEHALTTIGSLPHSPAYASPEQLDVHRPITPASDVYQLGLIGYELLAGRRPFDESDRAAIRAGEDVPLPGTEAWRGVPPHLCQVIQRALRPRPADRYLDATAFIEALMTAQEDDATAFHSVSAAAAAAPVRHPDATEFLAPVAGVPVITAPAPEVPPVAGAVAPPPSTRRPGLPGRPVLWIAPLLLLLAVALWAARRGGDDPAPVAAAGEAAPDSGSLAALEEEFLRLEGVAARDAGQQAPAPAPEGAAPAPSTPTPATSAPTPSAPTPGAVPAGGGRAAAEAEISQAVHDLNKAWVEGDISRHVGHYASRVDYYNSNNLPRAGVRRDRTRDLRRYDDRRIGIHAINVEWRGDDEARVLVDKEWIFGGDGRTRQGRGMQEYVFRRDEDDGKWYVVSEQLLTTNEARSGAQP